MSMDLQIERLIPRYLLKEKNGYALAKAAERAFQIVAEAAMEGLAIIQDPARMPEWRLDELAGELGCLYDYSASLDKKRYWITNAIYLFSIYGTPRAIVNFLEGSFLSVDVEENWLINDGEPFHFNVVISGTQYNAEVIAWVRKVAEQVKNVRSVLDDVIIDNPARILVSGGTGTYEPEYLYVSNITYTMDD